MYSVPIESAFSIFPFIALLITIPYILVQYGKYGSINVIRTIVIYSFILYLICAYFLVILPLPEVGDGVKSNSSIMQLEFFHFVHDIVSNTPFVINDFSTYMEAIREPNFLQVLYNLLLLLPLGFYLRYYFEKGFIKSVVIVFLVSLFFELTQLSGLYGIYETYRLFDVDDLFINTLGGIIGFCISPLLSFFLPSREKLDSDSFEMGQYVSSFRRFCAFVIDWVVIIVVSLFFTFIFGLPNIIDILGFSNMESFVYYVLYVFVYFGLIPLVMGGKTIGKMLVNIRLYKDNIKFYDYFIRCFLLYILLLPSLGYCFKLMAGFRTENVLLSIVVSIITIFMFLLFFINCFRFLISRKSLFHESITKVVNVSAFAKKIDN